MSVSGYIVSYQTPYMPLPWSGWYDTDEHATLAVVSMATSANVIVSKHAIADNAWLESTNLLNDVYYERHHDAWSDAVDNWIWFLCSGGRYRCTEGFYDLSCEQRYFPIEIGAIVHEMLGAK